MTIYAHDIKSVLVAKNSLTVMCFDRADQITANSVNNWGIKKLATTNKTRLYITYLFLFFFYISVKQF